MWRKFPLPRSPWSWRWFGAAFEPVCEESAACRNAHHKPVNIGTCKCSSAAIHGQTASLEIVDKVHIPINVKPGKYVLGWRWDCEQSTQVWTSCSDVTIASAGLEQPDVVI